MPNSVKSNASSKNGRNYRLKLVSNDIVVDRQSFNRLLKERRPRDLVIPPPSPAVQALVERLLARRQVLKRGACLDLEQEMPAYFGDNPVVPKEVSDTLFDVYADTDKFEAQHEVEWARVKVPLLSMLNPGEVFNHASESHLLVLPPGTAEGLARPKPDLLLGFYRLGRASYRRNAYTLVTSNVLPIRAQCGDADGPHFPFFVQERRADRGTALECLNQLLGGLRTAMYAWEMVLERQNIAIVGMTLVGFYFSLYVMGYGECDGEGMYVAYHITDYSILVDRDLPRLMSLMVAVKEEGLRLFNFLLTIKWQDLQGSLDDGDNVPDPDPEGDEEDDERDNDRAGLSEPRHKKRRLRRAGAKDPVVDSIAKVQSWLPLVVRPEGPGAAPGAEDLE
ncbi:uncharacterized protein SPPG_03553 [Spizellomyces punctatus DAOM BR117]|uniref:Uncharacterized protein n=1 Tax=Spizellomyces punctatus (strain DAOM BR117) TaxID=645134 RepID=A0A0L0HLI1_SPIPD|nr:uncharacterized protein SPPG_03553 [Spizellomyces punctatus DAOM BR117]KND01760.1 hypothetical protein SPPG_03553 [Spizellomyces punctatus DAOM BR117]|eukprot:XP_016609799.1 hypothetical protein SPPG_03553 [Spizellomyces punctatus DAOM BR117]